VKELDGNAGDPEAERRARAFLDDPTPADSLSDDDLRTRLDGLRDLMAENELSVKTERALRDKLRKERVILRARVAKVKADEEAKVAVAQAADAAQKAEQQAATQPEQPTQKKKFKPNINIIINAQTPVREILRDRREAEELDESELRYRIRARRDFEASNQFRDYDEDQRFEWRERTRSERRILNQRMQEERDSRRVELKKPSNIRRIVIDDEREMQDAEIPEDIFAAEVEDEDIERALLAAPRRKIKVKAKAADIAVNPRLREAMTRIEIDTIRFGFNEAFVREEEVDNLDQIASVIERVLAKYPREVFLIEGHTDAVGSDAYNAKLSKARAEAVKKALSTYYIIPSKNLQTVGLGERYLKIPTAEQEQENRRVSLSRATEVVGELDE
jgi:outer membrane protein OmpA-like peptidoglycan-associated protein